MGDDSDFKAREKETYSTAVTKKLINLGLEASKDGVREYYEDAVLDFWTDIPSMEKHKPYPPKMIGVEMWPGVKIESGDSPMTLFSRIRTKFPPTPRDQPDAVVNNITRTYATKQITIDLYDTMGILRRKHMKSIAETTDMPEGLME